MSQEQERPSDFDVAMQYLAEAVNTYAQSLEPVVRAPFVAHVNSCIRVVREERERLAEAVQASNGNPSKVAKKEG